MVGRLLTGPTDMNKIYWDVGLRWKRGSGTNVEYLHRRRCKYGACKRERLIIRIAWMDANYRCRQSMWRS